MAKIDPADLVWIEDAAREFSRSRRWLNDLIAEGKLTPYTIEGDRKLYVSRTELARVLTPRVRTTDEQAG
jgi:hypothetical protein